MEAKLCKKHLSGFGVTQTDRTYVRGQLVNFSIWFQTSYLSNLELDNSRPELVVVIISGSSEANFDLRYMFLMNCARNPPKSQIHCQISNNIYYLGVPNNT